MPRKTPLKLVTTKAHPAVNLPQPPAHLGGDGMALWRGVQDAYAIDDPAGLELLRQASEAADRIASVRQQIDQQGELLVIKGIPRANPLCAIERDAQGGAGTVPAEPEPGSGASTRPTGEAAGVP